MVSLPLGVGEGLLGLLLLILKFLQCLDCLDRPDILLDTLSMSVLVAGPDIFCDTPSCCLVSAFAFEQMPELLGSSCFCVWTSFQVLGSIRLPSFAFER